MGFGTLFRLKRSKVASPKTESSKKEDPRLGNSKLQVQSLETKSNAAVSNEKKVQCQRTRAPLSIDASVFTDPPVETHPEIKAEKSSRSPEDDKKVDKKEEVQIDETERKDEVREDKGEHLYAGDACDSETCTKERCNIETCGNIQRKKQDSGDKISRGKLNEMINSSIKEAMETIVKQCRMEGEKDVDKKGKEKIVKSICHSKKAEVPMKSRHEHRQQICNRSKLLNDKLKSYRVQDKCIRPCPNKIHDDSTKRIKKDVLDESRCKRRSKSTNNVRTDNRRMTGNVNIYICSEATENTKATTKQKQSQPCAESSSETTTERSDISSSKLLNNIRKRRRKSKDENSLDSLSRREESSDVCSCASKYTDSNTAPKLESSDDVCCVPDENISRRDTESTLTDYKCKEIDTSNSDVTDKTESSFSRAKFVVCDKLQRQFASKISTSSESDDWSLKTLCSNVERVNYCQNKDYVTIDQHQSKDRVLCDRNETWLLEAKSICSDSRTNSGQQDQDIIKDSCCRVHAKRASGLICKCKKDRELTVDCDQWSGQNNYRKRSFIRTREKENFMQPWSTCACIEEEEEDVCGEESLELTVCRKPVEKSAEKITVCRKDSTEYVPCKKLSKENVEKSAKDTDASEEKEKETVSEEKTEEAEVKADTKEGIETESKLIEEDKQLKGEKERNEVSPQKRPPPPFRFQKSVRPEARLLKQILRQQPKPSDQTETNIKPATSVLQKMASTMEPSKRNENNPQNNAPSNPQNLAKPEPAFLKKFNLRKPAGRPITEPNQQASPGKTGEKNSEDKEGEKQEVGKDKEKRRSFQDRLKDSLFYKSIKKAVGKTRPEESTEKDKITEDTALEINTDKKEVPEIKAERPEVPTEPKPEPKNKFIPAKVNLHKIMRKKEKLEPSKDDSQKLSEEKEQIEGDVTIKNTGVKNEEAMQKDEQKVSDDTQKKQVKSKLLNIMSKPSTSAHKSSTELTKEQKPPEAPEKIETRKVSRASIVPEVPKKSVMKEKEIPIPRKVAGRDEKREKRVCNAEERCNVEKIDDSVCVQCVQRKLSGKDSKRSAISTAFHEPESRTVCANCMGASRTFQIDDPKGRECKCNCRYLPTTECNDRRASYPKSCLKKERQFYRIGSKENDYTVPCRENRNWEECSCKQLLVCNDCRRPRNQCSCRLTITCSNCCKPKINCNCKPVYKISNECSCMKSMVCLYCDNPREKCTCRAPIGKCSCCQLAIDLCLCKDREAVCDGRPVQASPDNDRAMYVSAWKPRDEVRRYFSRNLEDLRAESVDEWCCYEKLKPRKSDDLPYQRLSVFSDVMNELQQKISESTCCTRCRKIPCCCGGNSEKRSEERKIKYCVSPNALRKAIRVDRSKTKSSSNFKCEPAETRTDKQKAMAVVPTCCACKATPCRCRRTKSSPKKPKAKCYYCKTSPCVCITARPCSKSRPCRCADSPCRTKEKEIIPCGKTSTKPRNNEEKIICVR